MGDSDNNGEKGEAIISYNKEGSCHGRANLKVLHNSNFKQEAEFWLDCKIPSMKLAANVLEVSGLELVSNEV